MTYLSSQGRETLPKTKGFFSCCRNGWIVFIPNVMFIIQDFCLPPHMFLHRGKNRHLLFPLAALPLGFDRKGPRPTQMPTKIAGAFTSRAACCSPVGRENKIDLQVFFGSSADHPLDSYKKTFVGSDLKTLQSVKTLLAGKISYGDWMKTSKAMDMVTHLFCCHSWWEQPVYVCWHDVGSRRQI